MSTNLGDETGSAEYPGLDDGWVGVPDVPRGVLTGVGWLSTGGREPRPDTKSSMMECIDIKNLYF